MADEKLLFKALSDFARTLVLRYAVADVLMSLTEHVTDVLGVAGAGVSLGDQDGLLRFVSASSETITEIERVQELAQHGACVDAYKSGMVAQSSDLTAETRWPELAPDAVRLGLRSIVAIPMRLTDQTIGSLNIYDARPREWLPADIQAAQVLADMAVSYMSAFTRSQQQSSTSAFASTDRPSKGSRRRPRYVTPLAAPDTFTCLLPPRCSDAAGAGHPTWRGEADDHHRSRHRTAARVPRCGW